MGFYIIFGQNFRMSKTKKIALFWWSSKKFEHKKQENFGDIVGPYLLKKLSDLDFFFVQPHKRKWHQLFKKVYFTVGSILQHADKNSIVWGSGIVDKKQHIKKATFLAVRGPKTRERLLELGYNVPEVYGDPAILLPKVYLPDVKTTHKIGIIPHYVDYETVNNWYKDEKSIKVISLLNDNVEAVIDDILSCEKIISSSLHGLIVGHAYQKRCVWVKFSEKVFGDGVKFEDYFLSIGLSALQPIIVKEKLNLEHLNNIVEIEGVNVSNKQIYSIQKKLLQAYPFKLKTNISFNI